MNGFFRAVAYAAWGLSVGLSVWLAVEFHEYKFGISLGVAILGLILSAFGLVMARFSAQDRVAMAIGIVLWAAGAVSFALTELGFWSSSYKDRHAEYMQVKTAKARQEGLKDMAWEALRTGDVRASTAEIEARIKAAHQHERWVSSAGCTNATVKESREFCEGYFTLEAKLASAGKLEALEARLIGEKVETKETIVHNVFAAADLIAENSSLTEREAATIVVLIIALVLMLSRDLLLIVANPFGGSGAARTAAKASGGTTLAAASVPPLYAPATRSEMRPRKDVLEKVLGVEAKSNSPEIPEASAEVFRDCWVSQGVSKSENVEPNHPDGPGTPVAKPEPEEVTEDEPTNIVPMKPRHDSTAEWKIDRERRANENTVTRWLRDRTQPTSANRRGNEAHKLLPDYLRYCRQRGETPLSKRKFSTVLRGELDLPKLRGADGKRKSAVMLFPIELAQQTDKRKVA